MSEEPKPVGTPNGADPFKPLASSACVLVFCKFRTSVPWVRGMDKLNCTTATETKLSQNHKCARAQAQGAGVVDRAALLGLLRPSRGAGACATSRSPLPVLARRHVLRGVAWWRVVLSNNGPGPDSCNAVQIALA